MSGPLSANVHSVDAIKDVRIALIQFQERATNAMGDLRQKIDRTVNWLELDRPNYWKEQERRAYDLVGARGQRIPRSHKHVSTDTGKRCPPDDCSVGSNDRSDRKLFRKQTGQHNRDDTSTSGRGLRSGRDQRGIKRNDGRRDSTGRFAQGRFE